MFRSNKIPKIGRFKYGITYESISPYVGSYPIVWSNPFNTTYGVAAGGYTVAGAYTDKYERATYSTETNATNAARLPQTMAPWGSMTGDSTKAYTFGGDRDSAVTRVASIHTYTYGSNTAAANSATLSQGPRGKCGAGMGMTIAYVTPGTSGSGITQTTEKFTLATDSCVVGPTVATTVNGDSRPRCAGDGNYLYLTGLTYTALTVEKIQYSTNTISTVGNINVSSRFASCVRTNPNGTYVYMLGGSGTSLDTEKRSTEKMSLSTETSAAGNSFTGVSYDAHVAGSTTKMYAIGGWTTVRVLLAQALTYSNDTVGATTGMNTIDCATWAGGT